MIAISMDLRKYLTSFFLVVTMIAGVGGAQAGAYNVDRQGLLMRGYDPVAYFTDGKPVKGAAEFTAAYQGATLHFASAANRDAFVKEPEKYLPLYGGFCAYGVASGAKVDGDPMVWKIVDGRLYLNINKSIGNTFAADPATYIKRADQNWSKLKDQ